MEGNVNLNNNNINTEVINDIFESDEGKKKSFYNKVFLYFGVGILISSVLTIALSLLFSFLYSNGSEDTKVNLIMFYTFGIVACLIVSVIVNFVIAFRLSRDNSKSIKVPYIIYTVLYGIIFSFIAAFLADPMVLGLSFLATSLVFISMAAFGYFSSNRISTLLKITLSMLVLLGCLCLINLVLIPFAIFGGNYSLYFANGVLYWLIEAVCIVLVLLYTAIDFARVRKIAEAGSNNENVALYCAYSLYSDFITLFLYILRFVLYIAGSKKN